MRAQCAARGGPARLVPGSGALSCKCNAQQADEGTSSLSQRPASVTHKRGPCTCAKYPTRDAYHALRSPHLRACVSMSVRERVSSARPPVQAHVVRGRAQRLQPAGVHVMAAAQLQTVRGGPRLVPDRRHVRELAPRGLRGVIPPPIPGSKFCTVSVSLLQGHYSLCVPYGHTLPTQVETQAVHTNKEPSVVGAQGTCFL